MENLIRPEDIDGLFRQMGAKPQALDLTDSVVEDSFERKTEFPLPRIRVSKTDQNCRRNLSSKYEGSFSLHLICSRMLPICELPLASSLELKTDQYPGFRMILVSVRFRSCCG